MKNFHSVRSTKKMLAHGAQQGMGPFHSKWPKLKKTAPGATNTQDGKAEQASSELNYSAPILGADREESQDGKS